MPLWWLLWDHFVEDPDGHNRLSTLKAYMYFVFLRIALLSVGKYLRHNPKITFTFFYKYKITTDSCVTFSSNSLNVV